MLLKYWAIIIVNSYNIKGLQWSRVKVLKFKSGSSYLLLLVVIVVVVVVVVVSILLNTMFHAPMGRFQLELIYYFTYFSPSSHPYFL